MNHLAIRVENLSKLYRIGPRESYRALRDTLANSLYAPFRALAWAFNGRRSGLGPQLSNNHIWALKDVSFEVKQGEVIGIIGRNGAGKTTLLKILSRVTEPTEGRAEVYGRVGSLLEVGTGFHPELTGRENIYLNGAILGMKKAEIASKFDEIVAFAEVEKFIDTPVKRYSSGMYLRLAFAVAAHLEPEILVVDEVLAVGDAAFQKKCLGKMADVASEGRTVLFVSHNMAAITRLCSRAILLDSGRLIQDGATPEVAAAYVSGAVGAGGSRSWSPDAAPGSDELRLTSVSLLKESGVPVSVVDVCEPLKLCIGYFVGKPNLRFRCSALFFTQGICAFTSMEPTEEERRAVGHYSSALNIPPHLLAEGEYAITVSIFTSRGVKHHYARVKDAITLHVFDSVTGLSARGDYAQNFAGVVRPLLRWESAFEGRTGDG